MTGGVLLTVSGRIPDGLDAGIAAGDRPRTDYRALASALGWDVLDEGAVFDRSRAARIARALLGRHVAFAWELFRRRRDHAVIVTDAEHTGLPLAALLRLRRRDAPRHVMICHQMSSRGKPRLVRWLGLDRTVDRWIVYSSAQERLLVDELGIDPERVRRTAFATDEAFFRPGDGPPDPMLLSVGSECRDYPTLIAAVAGLEVEVVIAANSPWSKGDRRQGDDLPDNVRFVSLSWPELRRHYQRARFVVVPLEPTDAQAGVTTILEAMASGRAVVYTRTEGQTDVVRDGITGIPVAPGDVDGLRAAIVELLGRPARADELGLAGRDEVESRYTLDGYVDRLGAIVQELR